MSIVISSIEWVSVPLFDPPDTVANASPKLLKTLRRFSANVHKIPFLEVDPKPDLVGAAVALSSI